MIVNLNKKGLTVGQKAQVQTGGDTTDYIVVHVSKDETLVWATAQGKSDLVTFERDEKGVYRSFTQELRL